MKKVGWGVLGAASIAGSAVLPAIAAAGNGRLVAVSSRSAERARQMVAPYPEARASESYEALLADPEVDAVYIPLVNSLHKEWSLRAFAAGKHVLCEKPIAMNAEEAEAMAEAADAAGLLLMEGFMYRFHPDVKEFIANLNAPTYVHATFGFRLGSNENFRMHASLGGGALLDVGCYAANVTRAIMGEPVDVVAQGTFDGGVDITVSALLAFADGRSATVWVSMDSPSEQQLAVVTQQDVHRMESPFVRPRRPHDSYRLMVESFDDSALHGRPVALAPEDSIANMKVLDRIRAAATR